jgi:hypothetical protein
MNEPEDIRGELARVRAELEEINKRARREAEFETWSRTWYWRIMNAGVNHTGLTGYDYRHYERKCRERERRLRGDYVDLVF